MRGWLVSSVLTLCLACGPVSQSGTVSLTNAACSRKTSSWSSRVDLLGEPVGALQDDPVA